MSIEKEKVERGHYRVDDYDIIQNKEETGNPWDIIKNYQKVTEAHIKQLPRLSDCLEFLENYEDPKLKQEKAKIKTGKGNPVFVVTDDFLDQLENQGEEEFIKAKSLFKEAVKDEQNRIRIIFLALIRRKIDKLEKMDLLTNRVEDMLESDISQYSPEQLIEFYEVISKRLEQESQEIGKLVNSL